MLIKEILFEKTFDQFYNKCKEFLKEKIFDKRVLEKLTQDIENHHIKFSKDHYFDQSSKFQQFVENNLKIYEQYNSILKIEPSYQTIDEIQERILSDCIKEFSPSIAKSDIESYYKEIFELIKNALYKIANELPPIVINEISTRISQSHKKIIQKIEDIEDRIENLMPKIHHKENYDINGNKSYVEESISILKNNFVETLPYNKIFDKLNCQKIIILVGDSGIGKTSLALMVAHNFKEINNSYEIVFQEGSDILDINILSKVTNSLKNSMRKHEIIIFDDFLGKTKLNNSPSYLSEIEELLKFISSSNTKQLILTSRTTMFKNSKIDNISLSSLFDNDCCTYYFSNENKQYTIEDCAKILVHYLKKNNLNNITYLLNDIKSFMEIIDHVNFSPLIIERATKNCNSETPEYYAESILKLLNNPDFVWDKEFNSLESNAKNYLFILYSLSDSFVEKSIINECYTTFCKKTEFKQKEHINDILARLSALIIINNNFIKLRHPSLIDYLYKKIYELKDDIISSAVYIEQIEKLDEDKKIIRELINSPDNFFGFKVRQITFSSGSFPNSITSVYLKHIYEFNIRDKNLEPAIIAAIKISFKYPHLFMFESSNVVISIIYMNFYNLEDILQNVNYMEIICQFSDFDNLGKIIEITHQKSEQGYDFLNFEDYIKDEILNKLGIEASAKIEDYVASLFKEYLEDCIDNYNKDDDYDDIAFDVIEYIFNDNEDILFDVGKQHIISMIEKHNIYNIDLDKIEYESCSDNLIGDYTQNIIYEYFLDK